MSTKKTHKKPMKTKWLFYLLLISCSVSLTAQELRTRFGDVYYDANMYKKQYKAVQGSPYLDEAFASCQINDISETQFVRFNAYEGKVEARVSTTKVVELDGSDSYVIVLKDGSGKIYETHSFTNSKGEVKYSFFELLHRSDEYSLYLKENIKYQKEVKAEAYKEAQPASFKKAESTFFINDQWKGSEDLVELPTRQKSILDLFPDKAKSIKNAIKSERLKLDRKDDLIRILDLGLKVNSP